MTGIENTRTALRDGTATTNRSVVAPIEGKKVVVMGSEMPCASSGMPAKSITRRVSTSKRATMRFVYSEPGAAPGVKVERRSSHAAAPVRPSGATVTAADTGGRKGGLGTCVASGGSTRSRVGSSTAG